MSKQVSPDGKWWWDGQQWQHIPEQQLASTPPRRPVRRWHWFAGGIAALLVINIFIAAVASSGGASKTKEGAQAGVKAATASSLPTTTPTHALSTASTAPPAPKTLLDLSGSGAKASAPFQAPSHWTLSYSYDCSSFGYQGNFQVTVMDNSGVPVAFPVNELGTSGQSQSDVYNSGQLHIEVNSECDWHVTAVG
ncbi:MAG: hypothetical protein J2P57_00510 [Acidimicrobiaceae bacterium]|nr:hypothetical protein [Acidimicrobiaceae bacterium]